MYSEYNIQDAPALPRSRDGKGTTMKRTYQKLGALLLALVLCLSLSVPALAAEEKIGRAHV